MAPKAKAPVAAVAPVAPVEPVSDDSGLPRSFKVKNTKTGKEFLVSRKHYLGNQDKYERV